MSLELYRKCVGVFLVNCNGQVFVAKRIINDKNKDIITRPWQMPQGGIDEGENPEQALYREIEEETNLKSQDIRILKKSDNIYKYKLPQKALQNFWGGKYIGQEQTWFCCFLKTSDSKININTKEPEFEAWKWISHHSLPSIAVDFKFEIYKNLSEEFHQTVILAKNL